MVYVSERKKPRRQDVISNDLRRIPTERDPDYFGSVTTLSQLVTQSLAEQLCAAAYKRRLIIQNRDLHETSRATTWSQLRFTSSNVCRPASPRRRAMLRSS